jgi:hypothetical protein
VDHLSGPTSEPIVRQGDYTVSIKWNIVEYMCKSA